MRLKKINELLKTTNQADSTIQLSQTTSYYRDIFNKRRIGVWCRPTVTSVEKVLDSFYCNVYSIEEWVLACYHRGLCLPFKYTVMLKLQRYK